MVPSAPPTASSSRAGTAQSRTAPVARARVPTGTRAVSNASTIQLQELQHALVEVEGQSEGFEKERDFYFESKLLRAVYCKGKELMGRTEEYRGIGAS